MEAFRTKDTNPLTKVMKYTRTYLGETWSTPITKKNNGKRIEKASPVEPNKTIHTSGMATEVRCVCVKVVVAAEEEMVEEVVVLGQKWVCEGKKIWKNKNKFTLNGNGRVMLKWINYTVAGAFVKGRGAADTFLLQRECNYCCGYLFFLAEI